MSVDAARIEVHRRSEPGAWTTEVRGEGQVAALVCSEGHGRLGRADAEFVKARTGFSIGGVAPLAHASDCVTLIDRELFRFDEIWAAAGHPHAVFKLTPQQLQQLTGAPVADVVEPVGATAS